jgi:hypothetical protein
VSVGRAVAKLQHVWSEDRVKKQRFQENEESTGSAVQRTRRSRRNLSFFPKNNNSAFRTLNPKSAAEKLYSRKNKISGSSFVFLMANANLNCQSRFCDSLERPTERVWKPMMPQKKHVTPYNEQVGCESWLLFFFRLSSALLAFLFPCFFYRDPFRNPIQTQRQQSADKR